MTQTIEQSLIEILKQQLRQQNDELIALRKEINQLKQQTKSTKKIAALEKPRTMTLEEVREARIVRIAQSAGFVC